MFTFLFLGMLFLFELVFSLYKWGIRETIKMLIFAVLLITAINLIISIGGFLDSLIQL